MKRIICIDDGNIREWKFVEKERNRIGGKRDVPEAVAMLWSNAEERVLKWRWIKESHSNLGF